MTRRKAPFLLCKPAKLQRGFAMILILSLIVLLSAYFITSGLNRTSAQLSNAREERTMSALLKAKSALVAYAASEQWQRSMGQVTRQLGALPCPDRDDDGDADCIGAGITNSVSLIGRLPWTTLGTDDLRDASGERLWYALSRNFRKLSGVTVVNSDAQGQLTVTGTATASNVVAVVIAPGPVILGQDRVAGHNNPLSYLEGFNANDNVNFIFTTNARPSDTLNDRFVVITQADLMASVEPMVAARIERNIKPYLRDYFNQWGAYPFPAAFSNPSPGTSGAGSTRPQTSYVGDAAQGAGLLPITDFSTTPNPYPWVNGSASQATQASGTGRIDNVSCGSNASSSWCSFRARDDSGSMINLRFQVQRWVGNVGFSFAALPMLASVNTTMDGSNTAFLSPTISGSVASNGIGTITYQGTVPINCASSCSNHDVVVTFPNLTVSNLTSKSTVTVTGASNTSPITITTSAAHNFSSGARVNVDGVGGNAAANGDWTVVVTDATHFTLTGSSGSGSYSGGGSVGYSAVWFVANEWYRQTYYAVSPGYLPGGAGSCSARPSPPTPPVSPSCLMVTNLSPAYAASNDKQAVLILAGRSLNGSARPSSLVTDYLEGANATLATTPYVFENRPGVPTSINDRVVVVSP
jgi:hypothetical protein